jgi:signal peptidase I
MTTSSGPSVSVQLSERRGMAAVAARLPLARVPSSFGTYLDQVYALSRSGAIHVDGQNIFVYRTIGEKGDEVEVEFGVGTRGAFAPVGKVHYSELPVGEVATATHWGDYATLGETHTAVVEWCRAHARERTGTRWEVYGHWEEDPTRRRTDVFHLLK